jgi:hypothetical protein
MVKAIWLSEAGKLILYWANAIPFSKIKAWCLMAWCLILSFTQCEIYENQLIWYSATSGGT